MIEHTLFSLIGKIFGNIEVGVLGWFDDLGLNLESKSFKVSVVDSSASKDVLFDVLPKGSNEKVELRFRGLMALLPHWSSVVNSGVSLGSFGVRNDPTSFIWYQE